MYTQETYTPRVRGLYRGTQAIWYIVGIIELILAFRFAFRLLDANTAAAFTKFVYAISYPLVAPFFAVFSQTEVLSGNVFEWATLLAMFVYYLIGVGLTRLLVMGRPVTTYEARERLMEEDPL